jgi:hypothetical protein
MQLCLKDVLRCRGKHGKEDEDEVKTSRKKQAIQISLIERAFGKQRHSIASTLQGEQTQENYY